MSVKGAELAAKRHHQQGLPPANVQNAPAAERSKYLADTAHWQRQQQASGKK